MSSLLIAVASDDRYILRDRKAFFDQPFRQSQRHIVIRACDRFREFAVSAGQTVREALTAGVPEVAEEDTVFVDLDPVLTERILIRSYALDGVRMPGFSCKKSDIPHAVLLDQM